MAWRRPLLNPEASAPRPRREKRVTRVSHRAGLCLVLAALLIGCGPGQSSTPSSEPGVGSASVPKRLVVATQSELVALNDQVTRASASITLQGGAEAGKLVVSGLTASNNQGVWQPVLATAVPSVENGLWKLLPDGRMETTWTLRPEVHWHDGAALTSDDLVFTAAVHQDRDLPVFRETAYDAVAEVQAPDPRTLVVHWKRPYIDADKMFEIPLPRHLLEAAYTADKGSFTQLPYWSEQFVGTGPFTLREWVRGSHLVLGAYRDYVIGTPKIDEIEVRFISDPSTLTANILAGGVDMTLGRNVSIEQAQQLLGQWPGGKMNLRITLHAVMYPQFLNPTPPVVTDVQFRRALVYALDRQQMVDTLQGGRVPVADIFLSPSEPEYQEVKDDIVRYGYDPRKAAALLEAMGYRKGADGTLRDGENQKVSVSIYQTGVEVTAKAMYASADAWQRLGLAVEPSVIPPQRVQDKEYVANFPSFLLYRQSINFNFLNGRYSWNTPLPENNYSGGNYSRYMSPEFDTQIDRFFGTIPRPERVEVLRQIVHQVSDQVLFLPLFFDSAPDLVGARLVNVSPGQSERTSQVWNAQEWDVNG